MPTKREVLLEFDADRASSAHVTITPQSTCIEMDAEGRTVVAIREIQLPDEEG